VRSITGARTDTRHHASDSSIRQAVRDLRAALRI